MRPIRAIIYGVGATNKYVTRFLHEKGVEIVGAINRTGPKVGRDLGEVAELPFPLNVAISDQPDQVLRGKPADIVLVAVFDDMPRMTPIYRHCLESGLNVITVGAEASYPWTRYPELTRELDTVARRSGSTITGCGNQDLFMVNIPALLTGGCQNITTITHRSLIDVGKHGPEVAALSFVGKTPDEILDSAQGGRSSYSYYFENIISDLGLSLKSISHRRRPMVSRSITKFPISGEVIPAGLAIGVSEETTLATEEGILFVGKNVRKVCAPTERERREWIIRGLPNMSIRFGDLAGEITTATQAVNRVPDVINAEPGFITIEKLPKLRYRAKGLPFYID